MRKTILREDGVTAWDILYYINIYFYVLLHSEDPII